MHHLFEKIWPSYSYGTRGKGSLRYLSLYTFDVCSPCDVLTKELSLLCIWDTNLKFLKGSKNSDISREINQKISESTSIRSRWWIFELRIYWSSYRLWDSLTINSIRNTTMEWCFWEEKSNLIRYGTIYDESIRSFNILLGVCSRNCCVLIEQSSI